MTKENKIILTNFAEELATSKDHEEKITAAILFTTLGSIELGSIFELQEVILQFAKNQVKIIEKIEKVSYMSQN